MPDMPATPAPSVTRISQVAARRALASSALYLAGHGLAWGAGASLISILTLRAAGPHATFNTFNAADAWPLLLASGATLGIATGLTIAFARRWSIARAALELDTRLGLRDRLSSALSLSGTQSGPVAALVVRAGEAAATGLDIRRAIRIEPGRGWHIGIPLIALSIAAGFWMPALLKGSVQAAPPQLTPEAAIAASENVAALTTQAEQALESTPDDPTLTRELESLREIERELASGRARDPGTPLRAAQAAEQIAKSLEDASRDNAKAADQARAALANAAARSSANPRTPTDPTADDSTLRDHLEAGDIESAADALNELAQTAPSLSPEERARWASELAELAKSLREQELLGQESLERAQNAAEPLTPETPAPSGEDTPPPETTGIKPDATSTQPSKPNQPREPSSAPPGTRPDPSSDAAPPSPAGPTSPESPTNTAPPPPRGAEPASPPPDQKPNQEPTPKPDQQPNQSKDPTPPQGTPSPSEPDQPSKPKPAEQSATEDLARSLDRAAEQLRNNQPKPPEAKNPEPNKTPDNKPDNKPNNNSSNKSESKPESTSGEQNATTPQPSSQPSQQNPSQQQPSPSQQREPASSGTPSQQQQPSDQGQKQDQKQGDQKEQPAPQQSPTPPTPQPAPGQGPTPAGQPSTNPSQPAPTQERPAKPEQQPQGQPAQPGASQDRTQGQTPKDGSQTSPSKPEPSGNPSQAPRGEGQPDSGPTDPSTQQSPGADQQQSPSPSSAPSNGKSPQPGAKPTRATPDAGQPNAPSQSGGELPDLPQSDDAIKDLAKRLADVAEKSKNSQRQASDAQKLREQAEKMVKEASPQEREQLERLAREFQREMDSRQGDGASPQQPPPPGSGTPIAQNPNSGRGPMSAPRRPTGPTATQTVDARPRERRSERGQQVLAEWLGEGASGQGTSSTFDGAVRDAADGVERAIEQQSVPPGYQDLVRRVFQRYTEAAKSPAPSTKPAPATAPSTTPR